MRIISKIFLGIFMLGLGCSSALAQSPELNQNAKEDLLKARIVDVKTIREEMGLDGLKTFVQTFTLKGLEDPWKGKEIKIDGSEFNTVGVDAYKKNDVLLLAHTVSSGGKERFVIVDYVRETWLYVLGFLFIGLVILFGKFKGVKALVGLAVSFLVIIFFILPQILSGGNPVLVSALGGIFITLFSLYLTHGFKNFTHLAAASMGISLTITVLISYLFSELTKLTGTAEEQTLYLSQLIGGSLNMKGLLLAGFIIGALGVLDDIVINQISLVEELHQVDRKLGWQKLFQKGLKVGVDHVSAIVNSLFLAYVGASLPLLLFFSADQVVQMSFSNTINLEVIAVEIVRTLTGSIGLILAVPIATLIAAIYVPKTKSLEKPHVSHAH